MTSANVGPRIGCKVREDSAVEQAWKKERREKAFRSRGKVLGGLSLSVRYPQIISLRLYG